MAFCYLKTHLHYQLIFHRNQDWRHQTVWNINQKCYKNRSSNNWDLATVRREISNLSAAANSLSAEMSAASHSKTSSQQILPNLIVVVSNFRATSLGLARLLSQTSKLQDLKDALLGLHWPTDLIYGVDTGQQPMDSHTWPTDSCKS